jgi:hypothetical protein
MFDFCCHTFAFCEAQMYDIYFVLTKKGFFHPFPCRNGFLLCAETVVRTK